MDWRDSRVEYIKGSSPWRGSAFGDEGRLETHWIETQQAMIWECASKVGLFSIDLTI